MEKTEIGYSLLGSPLQFDKIIGPAAMILQTDSIKCEQL